MWIERLEVIGFGNLTGQRIEFDKTKVNIILEPNEYGKSTIAEAIWAILFDYPPIEASDNGNGKPGAAKQPLSGAAFKGYLDLNIDGRRLRVIRDFVERSVKVLDLSKDLGRAQSDVTGEFITGTEQASDVGLLLTGMGRDLFRSTCLVGQRELDKLPFGGDRSLSSLLLHVADSAGTSTTAAAAIERLQGLLDDFPYRDKSYKLSELLTGLQTGREMLQERLSQLESEKNNVSKDLVRLGELDRALDDKGKHVTAEEYFQLCLEVGDLDSRLMKAQERIYKVENLRAALSELGNFEQFPIQRLRTVEEIWTKRTARLDDMTRLMGEIENKETEARERDLAFRERSEGLAEFSIEDAQALFSLGKTLQTVFQELDEIKHKREAEINRVRASGVNLETLSGTRKSLLALESKDLDDAHVYHAMITNARDKISEHQRSAWRARTKIDEIDEQRTHWIALCRNAGILELVVILISGGLMLIQMFALHRNLGDILVFVACMVFCIAAALAFITAAFTYYWNSVYFLDEEEEFLEEEEKQSLSAQDLQRKILTLEQRLEVLAKKAGVAHGGELVRCIQEYATAAAQLKDLDVVEQMWHSRDAHAQKLIGEIHMYFQRANRAIDVTPRSALELADAIIRFQDDYRQLQAQNSMMEHKKSELRFLHDEVRDMDRILHEEFMRTRVDAYGSIDLGYANYMHLIDAFRRWELASGELALIESETTSDMVPDELPKLIERLEGKRSDVWERMQEIIIRTPEIALMKPPVQDSMVSSIGREISSMKTALEELRHERDKLSMHIRAATKNYDSFYLKTMEELETLDRDLETLLQTQASVRLAIDTFKRLAEATHSSWAKKLTEISREMLRYLATDYESLEFDANLRLTVRRKGMRDSLGDWQLVNQVSGGVREQVHLLARMAVARFLSKDLSLPIVLDEPFSEFDDERFTRIMKFLLASMLKNNQIILLSCHQQRHKWLLSQLDLREREQVNFCHLESLKADSATQSRDKSLRH
jgi:energy-coupling factor transporter ATP-binding protein EcfA2